MVIKAESPSTSLSSLCEALKVSDVSEAVPRISVITPVFNGALLLDRAVESLHRQTFQRWELLAIDDASTDDSHERLLDWSHRDRRIRVLRLAENRGHAAARNEGLRHAAGSLIAYLDHDDEYYPGYLERLDRHGDRADVFVSGYDLVHDDLGANPRRASWWPKAYQTQILSRNISTPLGVAHRRELLARVGGFDERNRLDADWDMWKKFTRAGASFHYLSGRSGIYHIRSNSLSRGGKSLASV
jgi:glycosyltransferase involved in cell wall biosynthesis